MSTPLSVSFKDRLCFEAHSDYILNSVHPPPTRHAYMPRRDTTTGRKKVDLDLSLLRTRLDSSQRPRSNPNAWRWVDFRPKYHTQTIRSPGMSFHGGRNGQTDNSGVQTDNSIEGGGVRGMPQQVSSMEPSLRDRRREVSSKMPPIMMTPSGGFDDGRYKQALRVALSHQVGLRGLGRSYCKYGEGQIVSGARRKPFRTRFRCSKPQDDQMERAQERRQYVVYPYRDPQPFDHRGLDLEENRNTELSTSMTPPPLDYGLPSDQNWKTKYAGDPAAYWARDINFKLRTVKSPRPSYDRSLLLERGKYSPAFSAYNAFLDRIGHNVTYDY